MPPIPRSALRRVSVLLPLSLTLLLLAVIIAGLQSCGQLIGADANVKVTSFSPSGECDLATNIAVRFSNDMVPVDSLDQAVLDPPLEFDPPIAGIARWVEKNTLHFYPDRELLPATEYNIRVKSHKTYLNGNRINEKKIFSFRTMPLKVVNLSYYPVYEAYMAGYIRLNINLDFNYNVDVEQLEKKLSIKGLENAGKSKLSYEIISSYGIFDDEIGDEIIEKYANSIYLISEPVEVTYQQQEYMLKISRGLKCLGCGESLPKDIEEMLKISPRKRLFIKDLTARYSGQQPRIEIPFSNKVSAMDAKGFISVSPTADFTIQGGYNRLYLSGDFRAGETYDVTINAGLPAADGSVLESEFSALITIPDHPPTVRFLSQGVYLPKDGSRLLEIETINIENLSVDVEQFFANNLVYALATARYGGYDYYTSNLDLLGRKYFETKTELNSVLNQPLKTTVDIGGIIGDTAKGVFKISARNKERRWDNDSRIVLLTDIGIMARLSDDYMMVWVNSLSNSSPLKNAEVMLLSKNNQPLLKGKTDSRGITIFNKVHNQLVGFQPYLITVTHKNDLSYLLFDDCLLPTSDFDVKGRPFLSEGYAAYLYSDRGIFRPGDTAHIASIVRGAGGSMPPEFPYFITVKDPRGNEFKSFRVNTSGSSFLDLSLMIPDFASTGRYSVIAHIGEDLEIGRTEFQVEEFMPDRIKVTVSSPQNFYRTGEELTAEVAGKFLFGPPAAGHKVTGHISIANHPLAPSGWAEYAFRDDDKEFAAVEKDLPDAVLDDSGQHVFTYTIPMNFKPPSALKALISASVSEQGGRAVSSYSEVIIHPYSKYLGLKLGFEGYAKPGEPVNANLIALDINGRKTALDSVELVFYRMVYHSVLKKDRNGYYRYVCESTPVPLDTSHIRLSSDGAPLSFTPPEYGRYKIVAYDKTGGHSAAVSFYASGWGYAPWSMENPDRIEIDLDRESYSEGDEAKVQIRAPFGGKLLITIEKEEVLEFITSEMEDNTAEITIPVKRDYFPNAYITATILKNAGDIDQVSAARAFGVAPLMMNIALKQLPVKIGAPEVIKPKSKLALDINMGSSGETEITVAAVDAGILQLTDFQAPDPLEFFHGKKKLHLKPYDLYAFIYPDIERAKSHLSPPGGKLFEQALKRHLNPIKTHRVKPVSLWSGIVMTDKDGHARVEFDVPQFNGKLIIMTAAVRKDLFGSATKEITVRDKIVLQESFPRFISPNDVFDGFVTLFNNTGRRADITVSLNCEGAAEMISSPEQTVTIPNNAEGEAVFKIKANLKPGKVKFRISASDGQETSQLNFELPNRPALPPITKSGSGSLRSDNPAEFAFPDEWIENTGQYVVQTSSLSALAFAQNINFLVKYPYGCLEQTTSRLFPLLYFNDLARFIQPELLGSGGPDYYIQEGITKLASMIQPDGSFTFWPYGRRIHYWTSIYASHFLIEAKKEGYQVSKNIYAKIVNNLKDIARGKMMKDTDAIERIYAAYVLAKGGSLEKRIINYLKDLNTENLPAFSRFQLAAVLAQAGDEESALALLPAEIQPAIFEPETGGSFNSGVRTNAIMLDVLTEIRPNSPSTAALAKSLIDDAKIGRWYTTQDNAFALIALGKYFRHQETPDFTGIVEIEGDSTYPITTEDFKLIRNNLADKKVNISIRGEGECYYYWQSSGIPVINAPEEYIRGIKISRTYLDADGNPLDLTNVALGTQVICHIEAQAVDKKLENVVINDLLPAGFEIENPRLKTTPLLSWLPEREAAIDYEDIRDDRLLLFADLYPNRSFEYYYSLRVVTAGVFKIPPVAAECMYNPLISGASSAGIITIVRDNY
jgi:uncharacterized protein YfaS (alpha-2-macroglobulin family)